MKINPENDFDAIVELLQVPQASGGRAVPLLPMGR